MNNNIKQARKAAGLTQDQLAELTGMTQKSVSQWECGNRRPNMDVLRIIAKVCNTTVDYLVGINEKRNDEILPSGVVSIKDMPHHYVPMLGSVAAGVPLYMEQNYDVYVDSVREADFALTVQGDSMKPTYLDGDVIYVKAVPDVDDGQVCVIAIDDSATLKHLYHIPNGVQLVSDNPAYKPMIYTAQEADNIRVLGVPVGFTRLFKRG